MERRGDSPGGRFAMASELCLRTESSVPRKSPGKLALSCFVLGIDREHCALIAPLFVLAAVKHAQMFQIEL